ncbi:MAG: hypothetical protein KKF44_00615 [Nanoarchaeota archaeon]|nr:hypothetical protein [Nanoarchaeota archaeon]
MGIDYLLRVECENRLAFNLFDRRNSNKLELDGIVKYTDPKVVAYYWLKDSDITPSSDEISGDGASLGVYRRINDSEYDTIFEIEDKVGEKYEYLLDLGNLQGVGNHKKIAEFVGTKLKSIGESVTINHSESFIGSWHKSNYDRAMIYFTSDKRICLSAIEHELNSAFEEISQDVIGSRFTLDLYRKITPAMTEYMQQQN